MVVEFLTQLHTVLKAGWCGAGRPQVVPMLTTPARQRPRLVLALEGHMARGS